MLGILLLARLTAAAPEIDGAVVFRDHCHRCHDTRQPNELSPSQWSAVAFHMRTRAMLTRAETDALLAFVAPPPSPGAPPSVALRDPVVAERCQVCHDPARIDEAIAGGRTEVDWLATLARMRSYGAALSPEEATRLAAWLASAR